MRADVLDDDGRPTDVANKAYVDAVAAGNTTVSGWSGAQLDELQMQRQYLDEASKAPAGLFTAVDQSGNPVAGKVPNMKLLAAAAPGQHR